MTVEIIERTESRLRAWWSAWKYVAILGLLFGLSAALNVLQWSDRRTERATQTLSLNLAASQAGLKVAASIAKAKAKDDPKLMEAVNRIDTRVSKLANQKRPAPLPIQCAPGKVRMDAVNAGADK